MEQTHGEGPDDEGDGGHGKPDVSIVTVYMQTEQDARRGLGTTHCNTTEMPWGIRCQGSLKCIAATGVGGGDAWRQELLNPAKPLTCTDPVPSPSVRP